MNKAKFIFSVDVEWDRTKTGCPVTVSNVSRLQGLHDLCGEYQIKPTYLCSYEVVTSPVFETFINSNDVRQFEIGTHLHPWTTPPFVDEDENISQTFPSELAEDVFRDKMETLTKVLKEQGIEPVSYRAGRFGFDRYAHTKILLDLGYKVECSVTPGIDWSGVKGRAEGGPDFTTYPRGPFYIDRIGTMHDEYHKDSMLEVPLTIFSQRDAPLWLRPVPYYYRFGPIKLMTVNFRTIKRSCEDLLSGGKEPVFHMFMHSNELDENTNPYFTSQKKVRELLLFLKRMFSFINQQGIDSMTLEELYVYKKCQFDGRRLKKDRYAKEVIS